jgi:Arc/MetJ family transcription regulator
VALVYARLDAHKIELDDADVARVVHRYGLRTKFEAVALALRRAAGEPMTREEALAMEGGNAIGEIPHDEPRGV